MTYYPHHRTTSRIFTHPNTNTARGDSSLGNPRDSHPSPDTERKHLAGCQQILGTKRNYPFEVHQQTVNPADVFSTIQNFTQMAEPSASSKKQKLSESTSFLLDIIESGCNLTPTADELAALEDAMKEPKEEEDAPAEDEFTVATPPASPEHTSPTPPPALPLPCLPMELPIPTRTPTYSNIVNVNLSFGKRGNGNQPWQSSGVAPCKIGKMRRITFQLSTASEQPLSVAVRARVCDDSPDEHKGRLVLCQDDRCCVKRKVEGKRKPVIQCQERLTELEMPPVEVSAAHSPSLQFYLKPEWNGLGAGKTRPCFDVVLEIVDMHTGNAHELLSWNTELQSHKFESSAKAKSLEKGSRSSLTREVSL